MDSEDAFRSGVRGIYELIRLEPALETFSQSLFSESSKTFSRSMETTPSLEKLDETIGEFLRLLSPYFLLRPSHKCLQWLIYAYHIHTHNLDSLMECSLPYYQTSVFVKLIDFLQLKNDSRWSWLNVATLGKELGASRIALIRQCKKQKWLIPFVCTMVQGSLTTHKKYGCTLKGSLRSLLSFYCSTVVSTINDTVDQKLLSNILPSILKGLKSSHKDFKSSTMMIIGMLGVRVALDETLISTLLSSLSKVRNLSSTKNGFKI